MVSVHSPASLGMLYDVLDRDSDKMTLCLLEKWVPPGTDDIEEYHRKLIEADNEFGQVLKNTTPCKQLQMALCAARQVSSSTFIAAAFVANGIPMYVKHNTSERKLF